jgi:hypothetical protein
MPVMPVTKEWIIEGRDNNTEKIRAAVEGRPDIL